MRYCDKTVAYIDRATGDEIIEIEATDVLPRRGQLIRFAVGAGKGNWTVYDVQPVTDAIFDAVVMLDRRDT